MFSKSELKDLDMMVQDYYDRTIQMYSSPVATESAKRDLAVSMAKARDLLIKIKENVSTLEVPRYEL